MIRADGWTRYSTWDHSATVRDLYASRCRLEAEEMTCAAQAAELLQPLVRPGDVVLDAGCGSGYFYHSLRRRGLPVDYYGIDASAALVTIGQEIMPAHGLPADRLRTLRIEDLDGDVEHVICMNVLSNIDNYHRPLDRLLTVAKRSVILRESCWDGPSTYTYVRDDYLDPGVDLWTYVNTYSSSDVISFIEERGFCVRRVTDHRSNGEPELVIGYPHHWTFFVAERRG